MFYIIMVFSLTLEPITSSLQNITCNEKYNFNTLNKLITSSLLNIDPWNNHENEKEQLIKYSKVNGVIKYKKTCKFGRVYGIGGLGLQNLRREIRHTIARDYYYDVDIVSAHPVILNQILKQHNIQCPYLDKYVKEREYYLNEVMTIYKVDRHTAKELFTILLYGGSFNRWVDNNKSKGIDKTTNYGFIDKLHNEVNDITKTINDATTEIAEEIKKKKTEAILTHLLQAFIYKR